MTRRTPQVYDYLLLFALASVWGGAFVLTKIAVDEIPPATQTVYRLFLSVGLLWAIFLWLKQALPRDFKTHVLLLLAGLLNTAMPFFFIAWGQQVVAPGLTSVLMAFMPLVTLIVAHFFTDDEKFSLPKVVGVFLGIIGVAVLVGPSILVGFGGDILHQGAILLAAGCYAGNAVVTKFLLHLTKTQLITLSITYGFVPMVLFAWLIEGPFTLGYSFAPLAAVALLAIFQTVLASFLMVMLINRQGANFFSQINLLIPLFGVFWAFLIFSEQPSINSGLALLIILLGVFVASRRFKPDSTGA
ncbi:MAG: DMT family transporter [Hyphomicrobiales bacterium]